MSLSSRGRAMREARRTAQFAKFRLINLNLVPLVDTFVSIVFFALTTQTVGELTPVMRGANLPESRVGNVATQELTLGIGSNPAQVTFGGRTIMTVQQAALARSEDPRQPLAIPQLYAALKQAADSIRAAAGTPANQSVETKLAIQGDRSMRYDLLSRVMQTARLAGFKNLTLQVLRTGADGAEPQQAT